MSRAKRKASAVVQLKDFVRRGQAAQAAVDALTKGKGRAKARPVRLHPRPGRARP